jgi:hypothetical protein
MKGEDPNLAIFGCMRRRLSPEAEPIQEVKELRNVTRPFRIPSSKFNF